MRHTLMPNKDMQMPNTNRLGADQAGLRSAETLRGAEPRIPESHTHPRERSPENAGYAGSQSANTRTPIDAELTRSPVASMSERISPTVLAAR